MGFLELESSKAAYRADFALYGLAVAGLGGALLLGAPGPAWPLLATALGGYGLWSLLEYTLHRFVLHGMQPFRGMHELHHMRPGARIGTPTVVSAPLFALLVFAPTWALAGLWPACALSLGVLAGYLAYAVTHHLCHHGQAHSAWRTRHQRWHARHHQRVDSPGCFGVSHRFWDHMFGTDRAPFRQTGGPYRRTG
jgi:sterol desaturase/sphingolipid hydroxylase (fatty acid hydroxylase superfamily)